LDNEDGKLTDLNVTAFHSVFAYENKVKISEKTINLPGKISKITSCNRFCLLVLENGNVFQYIFAECELKRLNFTNVEEQKSGIIAHISCNDAFSVAVTDKGVVYNIPNKTHTFPKHVRVKKIVCGIEHCLLLTTNGDVYSWGTGL
jgi:alpha-tubulin suppressor-like RCC1 family protein